MRDYRPWTNLEIKFLQIGFCPQGRTQRACRVFCRRNGIKFVGKRVTDENEELINRIDKQFTSNQKGNKMTKQSKTKKPYRAPATMDVPTKNIVENPNNPRTNIDSIEDLKASIKANGLLQPIAVRINNKNKFEVMAGSRRFKACKELGLEKIPCTIFHDIDDEKAYELATTENIVRENMNAVDEANAVAKLFAQGKSRTEIAAMFGKSPRWAEGRRRIVELGNKAMEYLAAGKINLGHAEVLTMCHPEDVERWLSTATWKSPEDLKHAIMNEKPLLERAPFNAKKTCKDCENRSDCQRDLFGDVQNSYCLDKECFKKNIKKEADRIRKDYIKQGFEEVPEDKRYEAEHSWDEFIDAETDDKEEQETIEEYQKKGVKPKFWVNEKTADHGLVYSNPDYIDETPVDFDDEPTDPDSWEYKFDHFDYKTKNKVNEAAIEAEKRAIRNDLKNIFAGISKPAQALLMELFSCYFDAKDEDGSTHEESYLKHIGESDTEDEWCELFITCVADECVSMWSGMNKALREFFNIASRETFEQEAYEEISKDADNTEESDENGEDSDE